MIVAQGIDIERVAEMVAARDRQFGEWWRNVREEMRAREVPAELLQEVDIYDAFYGGGYDPVTFVDVLEWRLM